MPLITRLQRNAPLSILYTLQEIKERLLWKQAEWKFGEEHRIADDRKAKEEDRVKESDSKI